MKRFLSSIVIFALLLSIFSGWVMATEPAAEFEEAIQILQETPSVPAVDFDTVYRITGDYIVNHKSSSLGFDNEWIVIGLNRSARVVPESYYESILSYVQVNINDKQQLHPHKSVDNSRLILALTALGKDVTNVAGHNLLTGLNQLEYVTWQGINGAFWALIAMDCHDYEITGGDVTREVLIQTIVKDQLSDGGWSLNGLPSDPDMTAMAVLALAPHYGSSTEAKAALDTAVATLGQMQDEDGGFSTYGEATCESSAQVITALCAMGIDPHTDPRFIKNGFSAVDALCDYFVEGGGFCHLKGDLRDDLATQQGYYALCAYDRFLCGKTALFDMSDVVMEEKKEEPTETTEPSDSTVPSESTEPTEDTETSDPTDATEETDPTESTEPTDATEETQPTDSTEPSETTEPTEPSETTEPTEETEPEESTESIKTITVRFSVFGDYQHDDSIVHTYAQGGLSTWLGAKDYVVDEGSTVKDVLESVLKANGMSWSNPTGNYVASINGLSEFDNGSKSGWMYSVNGNHSSRSVAQYTLHDGDVVVLHYTDDFTLEQGGSGTQDDQKKAEVVEKLIDEIGTVTLESEEKIKKARNAYDALTDAQKKQVENYSKLTDAEKKLAQLQASEEDKEKIQEVEKLIDEIGEASFATEWKIKAARKAYDALTEQQKAQVDNYEKLIAAENQLARLAKPSAEEVYQSTGDYMVSLGTPIPGSIGGEWMVLGLSRSGREVPEDYYDLAVSYVQTEINEKEQMHRAKSSENARMILALTALGLDVTDVGGHNLLVGLSDMDFVKKQGVNGPFWALIAFDSASYKIPEGNVTREGLIDSILDAQLSDGGWALSGEKADPDMTGMALQALAPYYNSNEDVKKALDRALDTLSDMQSENGSYSGIDGENCESMAQIIVGLCALGIDPEKDGRYIKNGISVMDALCEYYVEGGGFRHLPGENLDGMATEQGYYALAAYFRMLDGKTALYDMSDVQLPVPTEPTEESTESTETTEETVEETAEPAVEEERESGSAMWLLWVFLIAVSLAVVLVLILKKNSKQGKYAK